MKYRVVIRDYLRYGEARVTELSAVSIGAATYLADLVRRAAAKVGQPADVWMVPA